MQLTFPWVTSVGTAAPGAGGALLKAGGAAPAGLLSRPGSPREPCMHLATGAAGAARRPGVPRTRKAESPRSPAQTRDRVNAHTRATGRRFCIVHASRARPLGLPVSAN